MSWIIGYVGTSLSRERRERLSDIAADSLITGSGRTHFFAAGGLHETCLGGKLEDDRGEWCVVGTGVLIDERAGLLSTSDWRRRLLSPRPDFDKIGGGFVAVRVRDRRVEAFSDVFGLRSLYWLRVRDGTYFSTRPEWLARLAGGLSLDWPTFGSHWIAYNQLSSRSLVRGLGRLGPGGYATLTGGDVAQESRSYALPIERPEFEVQDALRILLDPADPRTVSLGLSGGMDSRTLLAVHDRKSGFAVHVFGSKHKADVKVALKVAEGEGIPFSHFHVRPPGRDRLLEVVRGHAVQTQAVSPASSALALRYYPELRSQRKLVVDGGFGEILRRQFMNRLIRRGSDAVKTAVPERLLACIRFERARVFNAACGRVMEDGALRDIAGWLDDAPDRKKHGVQNVVDLLNVHTRLPNFFGYEQARLDGLVQNFMPFAHPHAVDAAFHIPAARRRGGRVSRRIVARHAPRLRRYPLVKGGVEFPYGLPPMMSKLWIKNKSRLTSRPESADRTFVLDELKDFVFDRIHSSEVRNHPVYDWAALVGIVEAYYGGGTHGAQLDWWLAFELWRAEIESSAGDASILKPESI